MDFSTIIGLLIGTVLVLSSILFGEKPTIFLNYPSLLIVVGGTLGVTFIKNPLDRVFSTIQVVKNAFFGRVVPTKNLIEELVTLSRKARRAILETEINFLVQRHRAGQELMEGVATSAPAFGMIGTLIGLVNMLASMDDPATIGTSMAVAIVTTLYGALIAHLFANPIAEKLKHRSREEVVARMIVLQGVLSIVEGDHPASVEQKLLAFLEPRKREDEQARAA